LVKGIEESCYKLNLPTNEPADVARAIIICATANTDNSRTHKGTKLPFSGKICIFLAARPMKHKIISENSNLSGMENSEVL